jgi:hypothetical protein
MAEGTVRVLFPVYWIHSQSKISWGASPMVPPRRRVDREGERERGAILSDA